MRESANGVPLAGHLRLTQGKISLGCEANSCRGSNPLRLAKALNSMYLYGNGMKLQSNLGYSERRNGNIIVTTAFN